MNKTMLSLLLLALIVPFAAAGIPGLHDRGDIPLTDPRPVAEEGPGDPVLEAEIEIEIEEETPLEEEIVVEIGEEGQPGEMPDEASGDCPNPRAIPFKKVARVLELTETQREDWKLMLEIRHETMVPLRESLKQVRQDLAEFLEDPAADPATGGELLQEAKSLREAIRQAHRIYLEDFQTLLDTEQARKLQGIRGAAKVQPLIPAFRATGLVAPAKHR